MFSIETRCRARRSTALALALLAACSEERPGASRPDASAQLPDAPAIDASVIDAAIIDAAIIDAVVIDVPPPDAPPPRGFGAGFSDLTAPIEAQRPLRFIKLTPMTTDNDGLGVFADLDGEGPREVIVSGLRSDILDNPPPADIAVYRYDLGDRALHRIATPFEVRGAVSGALDLDGDGVVDLLLHDASRPIAWGERPGHFAAPTPLEPPERATPDLRRLTAWHLDDVDADGWLDLVASAGCCGDACTDVHLFLRTAPRVFERRPDLYAMTVASKPYAVLTARFSTGDPMLASLGWSCRDALGAPVFYRASSETPEGYPRFTDFDPTPPEASFRMAGQRGFPSIAALSPMGAVADDVDNDGALDLAVMLNPLHELFLGRTSWPFEDRSRATGFFEVMSDRGRPMLPWGAVFLDLDRDGLVDFLAVHGNDGTGWFDPPERLVGPQHVSAHRNRGGLAFDDATEALHLGRRGQFRALAVDDLDADGDPDLVVGGQFELPRVYRNDVDNGLRGLALRLRGTTSNHLGVGAWVTAWLRQGDAPQHRYAGGLASPHVVSEPVVFFGLGTSMSAARVRVTWPSGTVQELVNLDAGRLHVIQEPPALSVDPPTRHAPADGRSVVVLRVTPRSPDGSLRAATSVTATLTGAGRIEGTPTRDERGWSVRVVSPTSPGSARVTVTVDGVPLRVRPRVWWDR